MIGELRNAAKASPVEYELVCPNGGEPRLETGVLMCDCYGCSAECCGNPGYGSDGEASCCGCPIQGEPRTYAVQDLVRSGRTRARQFSTYPKAEPWR